MKFGLALPHYDFSLPGKTPLTFEAIRDIASRAEDLGFESVWVSDHLRFDLAKYGFDSTMRECFEWSTLLGALSSEVRAARLGVLVVCLPIRPPLVVARSAITLHNLTDSRFELGLGAGWYQPDFELAGVPFGTPSSRIGRLIDGAREIVALMELSTGNNAPESELGPRRPAVTIGGKGGPKLLDAVAQIAEKWNISWAVTPERLRELLARLRDACDAADRDPSSVEITVGLTSLVAASEHELNRHYERFADAAPVKPLSLGELRRERLVGTRAEVVEKIGQFEALGVEEIICSFGPVPFSVASEDEVEAFADLVIRS
ncbi:MAG: hypothetical protein DCC49_00215 [Acidobacteria bacterium]|nr:MAG: hypothetical protein DCC49_00215 [Acidobacteriota bacterium]